MEDNIVEVSEPISSEPAQVAPVPEAPAPKEAATGLDALKEKITSEKPAPEAPSEEELPKAAAPAYKAREKFKVMDQEHDVPAWLKPMMKDAESEKQVIELLEKAQGLESVKTERANVRKERDNFKQELTHVQGSIKNVRTAYQRGDIDHFLSLLQIPQERMLQWALDKVNYSQLPPEQKQVFDERTTAQRQAWELEQKTLAQEQSFNEHVSTTKRMLLDSGLERPEVKAFADAYNAKLGKADAFKEEVIAMGELAWAQSNGKEDLTPDQAIERVLGKWKNFIEIKPAGAAVTQTEAPQVVPEGQPNVIMPKATVIPNVQGRTSSPMKSKPRSIADLKKLSEQFN